MPLVGARNRGASEAPCLALGLGGPARPKPKKREATTFAGLCLLPCREVHVGKMSVCLAQRKNMVADLGGRLVHSEEWSTSTSVFGTDRAQKERRYGCHLSSQERVVGAWGSRSVFNMRKPCCTLATRHRRSFMTFHACMRASRPSAKAALACAILTMSNACTPLCVGF